MEIKMTSRESRNLFWGIFLIALGVLFLFHNFGYLHFGEIIRRYWPLILIFLGLHAIFRSKPSSAIRNSPQTPSHFPGLDENSQNPSAETINNVFGDVRLKFDDRTIRHFSASNVFGDMELDFSKAKFESEASLQINGIFGELTIRVPQNVRVAVKANFLAGESHIFNDHQSGLFKNIKYLSPEIDHNTPAALKISASVLFGEIKIFA